MAAKLEVSIALDTIINFAECVKIIYICTARERGPGATIIFRQETGSVIKQYYANKQSISCMFFIKLIMVDEVHFHFYCLANTRSHSVHGFIVDRWGGSQCPL